MTPPDVTAADRAAADALGGTWERSRTGACQHVNMTHIHYGAACNACIATALATMRAEAAPVLQRLVILANEQTKRAEARVTALKAALLGLMEVLPPDPRWHAAMVEAMAVMRGAK